METLEKLLLRIHELYIDDPTAPGLVLSRLCGDWYVSVVRYSGRHAEGKRVVVSVCGESLEQLLSEMEVLFRGR